MASLQTLFPFIILVNVILEITNKAIKDDMQGEVRTGPQKAMNSTIFLLISINTIFFSSFIIRLFHSLSIKNNKKGKRQPKAIISNNLQSNCDFDDSGMQDLMGKGGDNPPQDQTHK